MKCQHKFLHFKKKKWLSARTHTHTKSKSAKVDATTKPTKKEDWLNVLPLSFQITFVLAEMAFFLSFTGRKVKDQINGFKLKTKTMLGLFRTIVWFRVCFRPGRTGVLYERVFVFSSLRSALGCRKHEAIRMLKAKMLLWQTIVAESNNGKRANTNERTINGTRSKDDDGEDGEGALGF